MQKGKKPAYDLMIKIIIIGDSGVGKTCLLLRFSEDNFNMNHISTIGWLNIGIDFKIKTINVDGKNIKLQIWDTAGQDRFRTITQTYYKGVNGIILAYDSNDETSFKNIKNWIKQIDDHESPDVFKVLIGNKCDIHNKKISEERGKALAAEYKVPFFETSAKQGTNINELFHFIAKEVKDKQQINTNAFPNARLNVTSPSTKQPGSCC